MAGSAFAMSNLWKYCIILGSFQTLSPGVECLPLRLTGGRQPNTGRLEVERNGRWGTISTSRFDGNVARVVCRELGYRGYSAVMESNRRETTRIPVFLHDVVCTGEESNLLDCSHRFSSYYRDRSMGVKILCLNKTKDQIPFRLADGLSPNSGRLQINLTGDWQTVLNMGFGASVVKVACRNLGFSGVSMVLASRTIRIKNNGIIFSTVKCNGTESHLFDCVVGSIRPYYGDSYWPFDIVCTQQSAENVPLRLVHGVSPNSGLLEMQLDDTWARVCCYPMSLNEANVACRTMGYSGFSARNLITGMEPSKHTLLVYGWRCNGTETHLLDCLYSVRSRYYSLRNSVAITCTNHTLTDDFTIRLTDSITPNSGRLEIQLGGVWGTICNKGFDINDANAACRNLGYSGADGIRGVMQKQQHLSATPIWMSNLDCTGRESQLSKCSYNQEGTNSCNHYQDVAVRCRRGSKSSFPLRIVGGTNSNNGRLEIQVDGIFGTVCKDKFGETEGNVACRNLGYWKLDHIIQLNATAAPRSVPVWLDNVQCVGSESHMIECSHNGLGIHNCSHDNDVAIKCLDRDAVLARLKHGVRPNMGRLEIQIEGVWGTVCNDNFDYKDANVACRMLGFRGAYGIMDKQNDVRADSVLSIWLDNVNCTGSESHLLDCPHKGIGVHRCSHRQDVGLNCLTQEPVSARLMDGLTPNSGRLELQIDGVWGSVCRRYFGRNDAAVVCRMLGYSGTPIALVTKPPPRAPRSPLWMYDVDCNGNETSLLDCPHEIKHPSDLTLEDFCSLSDDISVMCLSTEALISVSARLVGGMTSDNGELELQLEGVWGAVSSIGFDQHDAAVACRMLGYNGRADINRSPRLKRPGIYTLWLGELQCRGDEATLLDCDHTITRLHWDIGSPVNIWCHNLPSDT